MMKKDQIYGINSFVTILAKSRRASARLFRRAAVNRSGPHFCQDGRLHKFFVEILYTLTKSNFPKTLDFSAKIGYNSIVR